MPSATQPGPPPDSSTSTVMVERSSVLARVTAGAAGVRRALPWPAWAVVVVGAATVLSRLPGLVLNGVFDRDEAFLAVMGDVVRHGGSLYVDVIDRKPPVVPVAYSLIRDFSVDMRAVRFVVALLVLLNGLVVVGIVRRLSDSRRAAIVAGVLSVFGTAMFLPADAQAANFELWGLAPASFAILAVIVARESKHPYVWFAVAGGAATIAADCKQPYIVLLVPVAFEAIRRRADRRSCVTAVVIGAVLGAIPIVARYDAGRMIRWVWADNGDYLSGGVSIGRALMVGLALSFVFLLFHLSVLYGVWATFSRRLRLDATVWVWLAASVLVLPIGLRFFGHYYQQVVPPLAVLTGLALPGARRRVWSAVGVLAVGTMFAMLVLAFVHRPDLTNYTAIGRYVQSTTSPTDRILVWGALPDVYVSAERDPAGIFLHDGYLTGNWASRSTPLPSSAMSASPFRERWAMFFADVATRPPAIVVDAARPGTDWATYTPASYPIGGWLAQCYQREAVVDGLTVWRRDSSRCPS